MTRYEEVSALIDEMATEIEADIKRIEAAVMPERDNAQAGDAVRRQELLAEQLFQEHAASMSADADMAFQQVVVSHH